MRWFRRPAPPVETRDGLAAPGSWLLELFGAVPAASGIAVTPQTAMRCMPVRCAVQAIAEAVGQLPLHIFARGPDGARERDRDHPAAELLNDAANAWTASSDLREQITRDALLHGNGFAFINRAGDELRELIRIAPETISVEADAATGEPVYRVNTGRDVGRVIDSRDLIHIKAPSLDGIAGESPVKLAREAIGVALVLEKHAAKLFSNGARPSGTIEFPGNLGADAVLRMKAGWQAAHGGSDNSGSTAILWDGAKFNPHTFSSTDAQFLELRRYAVDEIARAFRVPPSMLFEMGRATWGNSEEQGRQFVAYTLARWLRQWTGEVRLKLLTEAERRTHFAEFQLDALLQADLSARAVAYNSLIASRVLNPNEVRALENRPPYAGGDEFQNPNITTSAPPAPENDE